MRCGLWLSVALALILAPVTLAAQEFFALKGHGGPVMALAVSPRGRVASASFDNSVGLWRDRQPTWLEGHDAAVTALAFAGEDRIVSGGDDFAVIAWTNGKGKTLGRHRGKVTAIAISPDGSLAASASWDGTIGLWPLDAQAAPHRLDWGQGGINDVAFSADGKRLYAATSTGKLLLHTLGEARTPRALVRHGFGINKLQPGPGDTWLAYGAVDGVTRVTDPGSGRQIADFSLDRRPILAIAHSPAAQTLAVGDGHGYIMVVDTRNWRITRDFRAMREGPVWALAFSPDGKRLYAGGLDSVVYAWPVVLLDEYEAAGSAERDFLRDVATMPNGERQFMRKCSICHALDPPPSRKAGPTLYGLFGRRAGTVPGYRYSETLRGSPIVWTDETVDALFAEGPDHFIPGSKMPMQRINGDRDRADLIAYLRAATRASE